MAVEEIEKDTQRSPLLVDDETLNAYVTDLVCRLAGRNCASVRVYILEIPVFNATMYPNGMMNVFTGLLLRAENEAQLAFVLGHEIGHFLERHSIQGFRKARDTNSFLAFLSLGAAGAGVNYVADAANMIATGAFYAFNRDQERQADVHGFNAIVAHGYDPIQGAELWKAVIDEQEANPRRRAPSTFAATHPSPEERVRSLTQRAYEIKAQSKETTDGLERFREIIQPLRSQWLETELNRGEPEESVALFSRLLSNETESAELQYYLGEAYRKRGEEGDLDKAVEAFESAAGSDGVPAQVHRSLGLLAMKNGKKVAARDSLIRYLALQPEADDHEMIRFYIDQL